MQIKSDYNYFADFVHVLAEAVINEFYYVLVQPISAVAPVDCCLTSPAKKPTPNDMHNQVNESSNNICTDGSCEDLAPNTSGNMMDHDMRPCVLAPQTVKE